MDVETEMTNDEIRISIEKANLKSETRRVGRFRICRFVLHSSFGFRPSSLLGFAKPPSHT